MGYRFQCEVTNIKILCEGKEACENIRPSRGKGRQKKMRKPRQEHKRTPSLKREVRKLTHKENCGIKTRETRHEPEELSRGTKRGSRKAK